MAGSRLLRRTSRPVAMLPIVLNDQGIVDSLTENNQRSMWASRRIGEDEQLYLVHIQGIAGIGLPTTLVVKKFQNSDGIVDGNLENRCKSEMILLASIRHDNIVNVLHFIQRENAIMLVYMYQVNGSLDQWLHRREEGDLPLSWPQRKAIAIGVAEGLCHLHHGCNRLIVHHNITSINVLLDQNFKAVIASFGAAQMNMAGLNQPLPIAGTVFGNFGYAAPEYGRAASQLTEKVDTYSFGVVLLELVTGRVANGVDGQLAIWARDNCSKLMAKKLEWFKIAVDKGIPDQARYMEEMATVFRLGVDCTVDDPQQRPSMRMALKRLRHGCGRGRFGGLLTCYNLYITSEDVIQVKKGKVACEVRSADELILTELMFCGTLKCMLLQIRWWLCFLFAWQEKLQDAPKPREELDLLFYQLQGTGQMVANFPPECKVPNILALNHLKFDAMTIYYLQKPNAELLKLAVLPLATTNPDRHGVIRELLLTRHVRSGVLMGQGVQVRPDHGDAAGVRRQPDQGRQAAGGGPASADPGIPVDWRDNTNRAS